QHDQVAVLRRLHVHSDRGAAGENAARPEPDAHRSRVTRRHLSVGHGLEERYEERKQQEARFATDVEYEARATGRRQGAEAARAGILTVILLSMTGARQMRSLHAIYVTDSTAVVLSFAVRVTGSRRVTAPSG